MKSTEQYRAELRDLVTQAREGFQAGRYVNRDYGKLCMAVADLIERSDYGRKKGESEFTLPLTGSDIEKMMDGTIVLDDSFDGAAMQLLKMAHQYLGRFGRVSMQPYSRGLGSKSARVVFEPENPTLEEKVK